MTTTEGTVRHRAFDKSETGDRQFSWIWLGERVPGAGKHGDDAQRAVELQVGHDKHRKRYTASVSTFAYEFCQDRQGREYVVTSRVIGLLGAGGGDLYVTVATTPVPRYNARQLSERAGTWYYLLQVGEFDGRLNAEALALLGSPA